MYIFDCNEQEIRIFGIINKSLKEFEFYYCGKKFSVLTFYWLIKKLVFAEIDTFLQNVKANAQRTAQKRKKVFYKRVFYSHFASVSGSACSIFVRKERSEFKKILKSLSPVIKGFLGHCYSLPLYMLIYIFSYLVCLLFSICLWLRDACS